MLNMSVIYFVILSLTFSSFFFLSITKNSYHKLKPTLQHNNQQNKAGQLIDNTIGVKLGLATMTAAAAGQVVSDVSGVIFGGSLERFLHRYKLIQQSTLTAAQRGLPICRNVAMFGAVCGVALGCGLGASCLLFMDLEARERAERALQLQAVLNDMMEAADNSSEDGELTWESCTIHLAQSEDHYYSLKALTKNKDASFTKIDFLPSSDTTTTKDSEKESLAMKSARVGKSVMDDSASVLCTPIMSNNSKEVIAVLEFRNQKDAIHGFGVGDEKQAKVIARHIAIFMDRLARD